MKKFIYLSVLIVFLLAGCARTPTSSQSEPFASSLAASSQSSLVESFMSSSSTASDPSVKTNKEFEYKITDNSVTIVKYIGKAKDVVVPDMIDGYPVKIIGKLAFGGCCGIETLKLPDSIEVIENNAFEQTGIKEFVFPPKVTVISKCVFFESDIMYVVLPKQVQVIESGAFDISFLSEIFIPDSVTAINDVFYDCPRSLVLFYDNNPLVPQHAKECNLLSFKRSEYNPVLDVELVGGKPLNDDQNLGISQNDYNRVRRQSMNEIELQIQKYPSEKDGFDFILFENGIYNAYSGFNEGDDLSKEAVQQKLTKLATLLYQCGITEFDPKTVNTGKVGCFDKLVTAALYCRWPDLFYKDVVIKDGGLTFADKQVLLVEAMGLFDFIPDALLVTGYSEQQQGIWYYPKELPKVKTEVLSFDLIDGIFVIKIKFTDKSGSALERTFYFSVESYSNVGGSYNQIILKGIQ